VFGLDRFSVYSVFGLDRFSVYSVFCLDRFSVYSVFGLDRFSVYSVFCLDRFSVYSVFCLDRFHRTYIGLNNCVFLWFRFCSSSVDKQGTSNKQSLPLPGHCFFPGFWISFFLTFTCI
jgi:hypothetical protein